MKKLDWLILIILILSPILINYGILGVSLGVEVNGSLDGWLGFYGTLVGSLVTMFVLYRTRVWNQDDNNETRERQNKILRYQMRQLSLENLKKQMDSNYRIFDFQEAILATNYITVGKCELANEYLLKLNKDIEMQSYSFDLYLTGVDMSECKQNYINIYQNILKQYGAYVNDLILICGIKLRISIGENIVEYIENSILHLETLNNQGLNITTTNFLKELKGIIESGYYSELEKKCIARINEISLIHAEKMKLAEATQKLLTYEEKEMENILL